MPIETFSISLESTQDKQQYDTKITGTEAREKRYGDYILKKKLQLLVVLTYIPIVPLKYQDAT